MIRIITPVGISMFTNYLDERVRKHYGRDYQPIDIDLDKIQKQDPGASEMDSLSYKSYIDRIKSKIEDCWFEFGDLPNQMASAEISSIIKIAEEQRSETMAVHLIATDTLLSVFAAEMIARWFEKHGEGLFSGMVVFNRSEAREEKRHIVKGLKITSQPNFEKGFLSLIEVVDGLVSQWIKSKDEVIFNITSGYKAIVPILTLYGQLREIPLKYIYDESDLETASLVTLDNLPLNFDWAIGELFADYIQNFDLRKQLEEDNEVIKLLRSLKIIGNETRELTIIGVLMEKFIKDRMLQGKTALGFFAEYKVYEALIEKYCLIPQKGLEYYWDKTDLSKFSRSPMYGRDAEKETRIEIDLVLIDREGCETWYEVKSGSGSGISSAIGQFKIKLDFVHNVSVRKPQKFVLVLYKFDFQEIRNSQQFKELKKLFAVTDILFEIWYFDIPVIADKYKMNNKTFAERPIELHPFLTDPA